MFSTLLGTVLSLNQSSSGGMEGRKTGEGTAAWKKERVAGLSPRERVLTFDELPLSLHPVEDYGPGSEGSSPCTSQKGERRVGGSSIADPKGRGSRSCYSPPQRRGENAERSPRLRAYPGSGDEGRGGSYQTRKPSALGVARPRSLRSTQRTCRLWAAVPRALRPRPGPAQSSARPRPRLQRRVRLPPPERPWGLRARSRRRRFDS